ncbi:hypothetical protein DSECCO2_530770 [anaerobic digester metagenome]
MSLFAFIPPIQEVVRPLPPNLIVAPPILIAPPPIPDEFLIAAIIPPAMSENPRLFVLFILATAVS